VLCQSDCGIIRIALDEPFPFFSGMCAHSQANQYIQLFGTWPMLLCFDRVLSSRDRHRSKRNAEIHFDDFASVEGLSLVGDASVSGKVMRLTPARRNQAGAVWYPNKQPVRSGFDTVGSGCFGDQAGVR
jgi:hypothetical protein